MTPLSSLSRRERQVMEIVYELGRVTVEEVRDRMPDETSYSAVRATLNVLETKGHLRHEKESRRFVFFPSVPRHKVRKKALGDLVRNFFDGSVEQTVAALLETNRKSLTPEQIDRITALIKKARKEGR